MGAQALAYASGCPIHNGMAHWEVLVRARAIENQCYVFASAQMYVCSNEYEKLTWPCSLTYSIRGTHYQGARTYGRAMIVDPWGTIIAYVYHEVDNSDVDRWSNVMTPGYCSQCPQISSPEGTLCYAEIDLSFVERVRREMPKGD